MDRFFVLYVFLLISTLMPTRVFADSSASAEKPVMLVWGDSLSAAYGIPLEQGWVSLLGKRLEDTYTVINGSISGETTAGGLTRLPAALKLHQPDYVLLELGANDGLRGLSIQRMQANLQQMIELSQAVGAEPVLLGIRIPPNYGPVYTENFEQVFVDLAEKYKLPLLPFLLEGVALDDTLMQADGLHPTAEAQPKILEHVWSVLAEVLEAGTLTTRSTLPEDSVSDTTEAISVGKGESASR